MDGPLVLLIFTIVFFLMICGLFVLYFTLKGRAAAKGVPKEGDIGFERESRLFSLFQSIEDMMESFEHYVEETRQALEMERVDFLREKEELTRMNARLTVLLQQFRDEVELRREEFSAMPPPEAAPPPEPEEPKAQLPEPAVQPTSARAINIWSLYCQGKDEDAIAREMGIARSEVSLTLRVLLGDRER